MKSMTSQSRLVSELLSNDLKRFCGTHWIKRQLIARYSPHHNKVVERKNKKIMS